MPTYNTEKPPKTSTDEQHDGMQTSKNTTTKSSTFQEKPIPQPMPYHDHQMLTKENKTTKM
jgi:hypothetical protein